MKEATHLVNQRNFFREWLYQERQAKKDLNLQTLQVLEEIKDFIRSGRGVWTSYRRYDEFVNVCFESTDTISKVMGLTESSTRDLVSEESNKLYTVLGRDVYQLLESGEFETIRQIISNQIYEDSLDLVVSDLWTAVRKQIEGDEAELGLTFYQPEAMQNEIDLLTSFSKINLREKMERVSVVNLAFLMGVLDSKYGTPQERAELVQRIRKGSIDESN